MFDMFNIKRGPKPAREWTKALVEAIDANVIDADPEIVDRLERVIVAIQENTANALGRNLMEAMGLSFKDER